MSYDLRDKVKESHERILGMLISGEMDETGAVTRQYYPCASSEGGKLYVVDDPDDDHLQFDLADGGPLFLSKNQVRCLMHQLTDWLTG